MIKKSELVCVCIIVVVLIPATALAYLDPGTLSYCFQVMAAVIVGSIFAVRVFWNRMKSFFHKIIGRQVS